MKKLFLSIGFIACATLIIAQNAPKVTAKWETAFNKNLQGQNVGYIAEDEQFYYLSFDEKIAKYDKNTLQQKEIKQQKDWGKVERITNSYVIDGENYVVTSSTLNEFSTSFTEYKFYHFNKSKMELEKITDKFSNADLRHFDGLFFSPDSSKFLVIFKSKEEKKKSSDLYNFSLFVFDKDFNLLKSKLIKTSFDFDGWNDLGWWYFGELERTLSYAIDNDGTVYVGGREYTKDAYNFSILKLTGNDFAQKKLQIKQNGKMFHRCNLVMDKKNNLSAFGFYSDTNDLTQTGGYFFTIDKDFNKIGNIIYKNIKLDYLYLYGDHSRSAIKKNKDGSRYHYYSFKRPQYADNGDIVLCAEEDYIITNSNTIAVPVVNADIYVFRANPETGLTYMKRVPKYQKTNNSDHSIGFGHKTLLSGDNVVVLFMDNTDNLKADENTEKIARAAFSNDLVSVTIDKAGVQKRQKLSIGVGEDLVPTVGASDYLSNSRIIIREKNGKKCKIGVISIE